MRGTIIARTLAPALAFCAAALLACVGACADHVIAAPEFSPPVLLVRVGGDQQRAPGLATLGEPLAIRAIDPVTLAPIPALKIRFELDGASGGARLSDSVSVTNRDGVARVQLTLGAAPDSEVRVLVRGGQNGHEQFEEFVTATPIITGVIPATIHGGDTVTVLGHGLTFVGAAGVIRFDSTPARPIFIGDTSLRVIAPPCLTPGALSVMVTNGGVRTAPVVREYASRALNLALAPLQGAVVGAQQLDQCLVLTGENATYLVVAGWETASTDPDSAEVTIGANVVPSGNLRASATAPLAASRMAIPQSFDALLRRHEEAWASHPPAGARVGAARAPEALPAVGATKRFMIISQLDATTFDTVTTRLRYAGQHVLVWVDTATPPELLDSDLVPLARLFDEELYPLDEEMFGEPSDVDGNGRVHVVLSPVVNALTVSGCTLSGFVSGFFSAHDLYPGTPHANGGEVFYGMVPDSLGAFGCPHPVPEFSRAIRTAFVHEFQHVINFNQHVLVRGGKEEEVWLNEGLSHIAEEHASQLYERRYPPPTGRAAPEQMFPDSSQNFIIFNLVDSYLFLRQPFAASLTHFIEGGTLEERGGMWLFLRWLADQYGEDILRQLVQTSLVGKANVTARTGEPFQRLEGDFAIAAYADSLPGIPRDAIPARWRFMSRNLREIYQRLKVIDNFPPFPISTFDIPPGGSVSGFIDAGGLAYVTVRTPPGAAGTVLRFMPLSGEPWAVGRFPQVSILRLQ